MDSKEINNITPFVTVVIPCRNESRFVSACLDSVVAQDYPKDKMEVLVVEGMSDDNTKQIIEQYPQKFPFVRIFNNPRKFTPFALNIGIQNARGEYIIWMSSHNYYDCDYVSKCINTIITFDMDNVGGIIIPVQRQRTTVGRCITLALSSWFGVGNSSFRVPPKAPKIVDTVFGGCYKKEVFAKIGFFNERLLRGQDIEFNLRMKKAGLKILLNPDIKSYYYARSDIKSFTTHNFINGLWALLPFKYSKIVPVSFRHIVPLLFVLSLISFGLLGIYILLFRFCFLLILGLYLLFDIVSSVKIAFAQKSGKLQCLLLIPFIFFDLHFIYGLGSLLGLINCIFSREFWKNKFFEKYV